MRGSVIWFDSAKGFGFIKSEIDDEIYFHWTAIRNNAYNYKTLYAGQPVLYEVGKDQHDRPMATEVTPIERTNKDTGKPITLCAFVRMENATMQQFQYRLMRHGEAGLKYMYELGGPIISRGTLFATDMKITNMQDLEAIYVFIRQNEQDIESKISKGVREVYTIEGLDFDIIFL